jgi:DNA-binding response OmpR family regulator
MKVLVCEDDIVVLKTIQIALERANVESVCVDDGRKALQQLRDNIFDLIITDIHMPYNNGDEILHLVREEQKKKVPIIMISSDTEEEVIALAKKLGVNEFVKKPIDLEKIQKVLKKYL